MGVQAFDAFVFVIHCVHYTLVKYVPRRSIINLRLLRRHPSRSNHWLTTQLLLSWPTKLYTIKDIAVYV